MRPIIIPFNPISCSDWAGIFCAASFIHVRIQYFIFQFASRKCIKKYQRFINFIFDS
jgi:hypothetical protein